ncbi:AraC family transcriptional regulator [Ramlibacter sp. 2FC]|uniref:AraC family transcriptional regulator n=1 Tax=Ramlibacter sp. 2FC TaxID=2502188 RepID=UPI0010F46DF5|nr:AraC family transcriptional regulator [Ramlibacter sp. 2FC]
MTTLVRSASLTKFSEIARAAGIDPVQMVRHVGLDRTCLYTPDLRIPEVRLAEVLEVAAKSSDFHSPGLLVAESWRLSDFGAVSLLLQHQPSLRHVLSDLAHYRHLLSDSVAVDVADIADVCVARVMLVTGRPDPGRQVVELAVGAALCLFRVVLGAQWMPRSVHFSHPAPASVQLHRRVFGPRLEFNSELDGIVLSRQDMDRPNPLADVRLAAYARDYLDMQPRPRQDAIADDVRRTLHALLPSGRHAVELVGQNLGLSARSLQRHLEQAGESYSSLVNEVRAELALRHLGKPSCSVSQVAGLLGFSEVSAFSRWFSAQFGVSPTRWRREALERRAG